jgi:hypothetical protein
VGKRRSKDAHVTQFGNSDGIGDGKNTVNDDFGSMECEKAKTTIKRERQTPEK